MYVKDVGRWDSDANTLRESRESVDKSCERGLLAMIVVGGKARKSEALAASARLMAHEHPDSDGLWLAEGVQDE